MADRFLRTSKIPAGGALQVNGTPVLQLYPGLRAAIERRLPAAAGLFAEPSVRFGQDGATTVSWYSDFPGEPQPLPAIEGAARAAVERRLGDIMAALRPLLNDPELGGMLGAALHVPALEDVLVLDGQPVLTNWGVLPVGLGGDPEARMAHFAATLGRFLPLAAPPPLTAPERQAFPAAPVAPEDLTLAPENLTVVPENLTVGARTGGRAAHGALDPAPEPAVRRGWVPLAVLLLASGATALWLLWPGTRIFPIEAVAVGDGQAVTIAEEANRALAQRADELRAAIEGGQCRPDGVLVLPDGRTPYGLEPPAPDATPQQRSDAQGIADPGSLLPPPPSNVVLPPAAAGGAPGTLLGALEAGTVLVVAETAAGMELGSGFFIDDQHVVTNHHVVGDPGQAAQVYVTNHVLGELKPARVLAAHGPFESTGADFAVLEVQEAHAAPFALRVAATPLTLQNVVAAGYPGDVLDIDAAFTRLMEGDASAVPSLTVTDGIVNTEQRVSATSTLVVHSAPISQGNSGGPLVDLCGRVVGVNTAVKTGELRNLTLALSSRDLVAFLEAAGINPRVASDDCAPVVASTPPAPAPAATPQPLGAPGAPAEGEVAPSDANPAAPAPGAATQAPGGSDG